jgi:hypothetical protein
MNSALHARAVLATALCVSHCTKHCYEYAIADISIVSLDTIVLRAFCVMVVVSTNTLYCVLMRPYYAVQVKDALPCDLIASNASYLLLCARPIELYNNRSATCCVYSLTCCRHYTASVVAAASIERLLLPLEL